jgi:dihydroflavonol-4-reductase
MKIFVTGASGHIGCNLCRTLLASGHEVRALMHADQRALTGVPVSLVEGDVSDAGKLARAFAGAEMVYHLAARISIAPGDEDEVHAVNVVGVRNVVAACLEAKVRRLVHFSSIHAFDARPFDETIDETRPLAPSKKDVQTYDRSKADGEREIQAGLARGLDAVIVNPTAVLGPNDFKPSQMGRVLLDLYARKLPALVEGGFDWVDVRDIVSGAIAAGERGARGDKFLLSGNHHSVAELARLVEQLTGSRAPRFVSPMWLARAGAPFATAFARVVGRDPLFTSASLHALRNHQRVSHDKATRVLGYTPRPLRETLSDTFAWFRAAGVIS